MIAKFGARLDNHAPIIAIAALVDNSSKCSIESALLVGRQVRHGQAIPLVKPCQTLGPLPLDDRVIKS
jgi:hypothetical protein